MGEAVLLGLCLWLRPARVGPLAGCWHRLVRNLSSHLVNRQAYYWLAVPFLLVLSVFSIFAFFILPDPWVMPATVEKLGQLGDSFGILNPLFPGLGFAGLTLTLPMQRSRTGAAQIAGQQANDDEHRDSRKTVVDSSLDIPAPLGR